MNITLYKNFSKKKNSTKQPTGGRTIDAKFKAPTSYENPTFIVHGIDFDYTYAKWGDHYYFINDIVIGNNDIFEIHCNQDVLATFKSDIGNYEAFIERSDSHVDPLIPDSALSREQNTISFTASTISLIQEGYFGTDGVGCYLIKTVGQNPNTSNSGSSIYLVSTEELQSVLDFMFNDSGSIWEQAWDSWTKTVWNPFQYILSILWVPFKYDEAVRLFGQQLTRGPVNLGWWASDITVYVLRATASGYISLNAVMDLPEIYYDDWRKYDSRFTEYALRIPGIGQIQINPTDLIGTENVHVFYGIDAQTGMANVYVTVRGTSYTIYSNTVPFYIPMQISQTDGNISPLVSGLVGATAAIATGGESIVAGDVLAAGTSAINGIIGTTRGGSSSNGNYGNRFAINGRPEIVLYQRAYASANYPQKVYGRPLCRNMKISELNGYIKCQNASIDLSSLGNDKDEINNYLNSGFYYE